MHRIIHCRWEALVETIFVQVKCGPGSAYSVAQTLADMDGVSEVYSVSGPYDLLAKCYLPDEDDVGRFFHALGNQRQGGVPRQGWGVDELIGPGEDAALLPLKRAAGKEHGQDLGDDDRKTLRSACMIARLHWLAGNRSGMARVIAANHRSHGRERVRPAGAGAPLPLALACAHHWRTRCEPRSHPTP